TPPARGPGRSVGAVHHGPSPTVTLVANSGPCPICRSLGKIGLLGQGQFAVSDDQDEFATSVIVGSGPTCSGIPTPGRPTSTTAPRRRSRGTSSSGSRS